MLVRSLNIPFVNKFRYITFNLELLSRGLFKEKSANFFFFRYFLYLIEFCVSCVCENAGSLLFVKKVNLVMDVNPNLQCIKNVLCWIKESRLKLNYICHIGTIRCVENRLIMFFSLLLFCELRNHYHTRTDCIGENKLCGNSGSVIKY